MSAPARTHPLTHDLNDRVDEAYKRFLRGATAADRVALLTSHLDACNLTPRSLAATLGIDTPEKRQKLAKSPRTPTVLTKGEWTHPDALLAAWNEMVGRVQAHPHLVEEAVDAYLKAHTLSPTAIAWLASEEPDTTRPSPIPVEMFPDTWFDAHYWRMLFDFMYHGVVEIRHIITRMGFHCPAIYKGGNNPLYRLVSYTTDTSGQLTDDWGANTELRSFFILQALGCALLGEWRFTPEDIHERLGIRVSDDTCLRLFSNLVFQLLSPERGDEIEQYLRANWDTAVENLYNQGWKHPEVRDVDPRVFLDRANQTRVLHARMQFQLVGSSPVMFASLMDRCVLRNNDIRVGDLIAQFAYMGVNRLPPPRRGTALPPPPPPPAHSHDPPLEDDEPVNKKTKFGGRLRL